MGSDFSKGCMDDIRLEGKHLPLPPALNGTQWGQATMARNLQRNCPSNNPCANVICPNPFVCVDLWMEYECSCPAGQIRVSPDRAECVYDTDCFGVNKCLNGGTCVSQTPFQTGRSSACICPPFFDGVRCEIVTDATYVLSGGKDFVIIIIFALAILLILVLVFVVYNRRREAQIKYPNPDDDVRENIINYEDEGGGEDDMTAFDITPLQIPVADPAAIAAGHGVDTMKYAISAHPGTLPRAKMSSAYNPSISAGGANTLPHREANVESFIEDHKKRADLDPSAPPFDDLRNYAYEGGGSTAGSLSSLGSVGEKSLTEKAIIEALQARDARMGRSSLQRSYQQPKISEYSPSSTPTTQIGFTKCQICMAKIVIVPKMKTSPLQFILIKNIQFLGRHTRDKNKTIVNSDF